MLQLNIEYNNEKLKEKDEEITIKFFIEKSISDSTNVYSQPYGYTSTTNSASNYYNLFKYGTNSKYKFT